MGVFVKLFVQMGEVALGLTPFSWLLFAYVSVLLLIVGPVFAQVAPQVVDPPARLIATDPVRVTIWLPLSVLLLFFGTIALVITIFGAMLMPIVAILIGMAGYLAIARLVGERIGAWLGMAAVPPWLAAALGIVALRAVRLVPVVGAAAHSLVAWVGFAAATCASVHLAKQWYRRRLPDARQFRGEMLVEWYPDGDPAEGPSVGTGRPVLGNVRGDEDRAPRPAGDEETGE
ncbi:MAG: hypothetical protein JWL76_1921 [Thermoleophilia bacterium]|nr:hypothetical protein [Thermoleophilia bacterium]